LKAVTKLLNAAMVFGLLMSLFHYKGRVLGRKKLFSSWANTRKTFHCMNTRLWRTLLMTACWNKNSNILFLNYWCEILKCLHLQCLNISFFPPYSEVNLNFQDMVPDKQNWAISDKSLILIQ